MRQLLAMSLLVLVAWAPAGWTLVPSTMSYQGILADDAGVPVTDGSYTLTCALYTTSSGGTALWTEAHPAVTVAGGRFSVVLGSITPLVPAFDVPYWLGIAVNGGVEMSRIPLTSSPYALNARTVVDNAITSAKITDNAVGASEIASDAVGAAEIANDAVGSAEIASGAVGSSEIGSGAVGSDELQDNSVSAADLVSEPGVAYAEGSTVVNLLTVGANLLSNSITIPTAGHVIAHGSMASEILYNFGPYAVRLSVSTTSGTPDATNQREFLLPAGLPANTWHSGLAVHDTFFFDSPGAKTIHLVGTSNLFAGVVVKALAYNLELLFVPTSY